MFWSGCGRHIGNARDMKGWILRGLDWTGINGTGSSHVFLCLIELSSDGILETVCLEVIPTRFGRFVGFGMLWHRTSGFEDFLGYMYASAIRRSENFSGSSEGLC